MSLLLLLALGPAQAVAPPAGSSPYTVDANVVSQFRTVARALSRAADAMPEAEYGFQPVPDVRSFAANVAHVADTNYRMCATLAGTPPPVDVKALGSAATTKPDAVRILAESFTFCDGVLEAITPETFAATYEATLVRPDGQKGVLRVERGGLLVNLLAHNNEMYGYMAMYLRLKGIVPPTTRPRAPRK